MQEAELDDFRWLVGQDGRQWLCAAAELTGSLVARTRRLRKSLPAIRTHLLLQQIELRRRAAVKFEEAGELFFTDKGLQQATDHRIANYKAGRFARGTAVADLCCGIGGDLLALARRGPVVGFDRDPVTALLAEANCGVGQATTARVQVADAETAAVTDFAAWHIDPDRRAEGRRVSHPSDYLPPLDTLRSWLGRNSQAAIKLAPATAAPGDWSQDCELEWISSRGECRQQVAWFGALSRHAGRSVATIVSAESQAPRTLVGRAETPDLAVCELGRYVFEPDSAVLAAGLTGELGAELGLHRLDPGIAYLTADQPRSDAAVACFEVLERWPLDLKRIRTALRQRGIGRLEIKKRGMALEPSEVRRRLQLRGESSATLLVAPLGGRPTAILARRVPSAGPPASPSQLEARW
jgi:SAM-dependent methyltransferase